MLKELTTVSSKLIYENPYWRYKIDEYIYPNEQIGKYYYVETYGSTFVIPITTDGKFVLTKQYRYLNKRFSIEFPGGGLKEGLTPFDNAKAELQEETGYSSNKIEQIGFFNPYNGVTSEICHVFIAQDIYSCSAKCDESEEFEILILNKDEINDLISNNIIWDGMTLAAWTLFLNSHYNKKL